MELFWTAIKALLVGTFASGSFAIIYELRGKLLFLTSLGGGISWMLYKILPSEPHYLLPFFLATVIASLYAEIMARVIKCPATIFQLVAMLPLVPGEGIFLTMLYFVQGENEKGAAKGGQTLAIAGALALGILMVSSFARLIKTPKAMTGRRDDTHPGSAQQS